MYCRAQHQASSLQQSSEDVIDCLPELIDWVDGRCERLQALVGTTLSNTQVEQVIMIHCAPLLSDVHAVDYAICISSVLFGEMHVYALIQPFSGLAGLAMSPKVSVVE